MLIQADISDPYCSIQNVELLDGNVIIGISVNAPYSFNWSNPSDSHGDITYSLSVFITTGVFTHVSVACMI